MFRKQREEKPRASDEDVVRIRQLRREGLATWTRGRLAKEFNYTPWFVRKTTALKSPDVRKAKAEMEEQSSMHQAKWGEKGLLYEEIGKKRKTCAPRPSQPFWWNSCRWYVQSIIMGLALEAYATGAF